MTLRVISGDGPAPTAMTMEESIDAVARLMKAAQPETVLVAWMSGNDLSVVTIPNWPAVRIGMMVHIHDAFVQDDEA